MKCVLLMGLLFLAFCTANARKHSSKTYGHPLLTFVNNDASYDFGMIPKGEVAENQFEIKNTGDGPLVITSIKCASPNVACRWTGKSIKPGKTGLITVDYNAQGDVGSFNNDIVITSKHTSAPNPVLQIRGAVVPEKTDRGGSKPKRDHYSVRRGGM